MENNWPWLPETLARLNIKTLNAMQLAALEGFAAANDLVLLLPI
jgi:hypothetical protein